MVVRVNMAKNIHDRQEDTKNTDTCVPVCHSARWVQQHRNNGVVSVAVFCAHIPPTYLLDISTPKHSELHLLVRYALRVAIGGGKVEGKLLPFPARIPP